MLDAHQPEFGTVFDADNHYWEASDAFTRHRDPKLGDRGLQVREINGQKRYVLGGQVFEGLPGPGDATLRPAPGAFLGYFVGKIKGTEFVERFDVEPTDRPDWFNRDARLKVMDGQGVDACWLFPSQAVVLEAPMLATGDIEASVASVQAFNRWLEEDWGFAYQNRIFAVPYMTLSDPDIAAAEMKWAIERGARVVNVRHGPAVTRDGMKSPANIMFDRVWALAEEAQVTVSFHAGADYSSMQSYAALREMYGEMPDGSNPEDKIGYMVGSIFPPMLKGRQIQDFAYILVAHRLCRKRGVLGPATALRTRDARAHGQLQAGPARAVHRTLLGRSLSRRRHGAACPPLADQPDHFRIGLAAWRRPRSSARFLPQCRRTFRRRRAADHAG